SRCSRRAGRIRPLSKESLMLKWKVLAAAGAAAGVLRAGCGCAQQRNAAGFYELRIYRAQPGRRDALAARYVHRTAATAPRRALGMAILLASAHQIKPAGDAAGVLALEQKIEAAVVRGDIAFVASVLSDDFSFVHGDGWTSGGKALMEDDKAAFLRRVADREY